MRIFENDDIDAKLTSFYEICICTVRNKGYVNGVQNVRKVRFRYYTQLNNKMLWNITIIMFLPV